MYTLCGPGNSENKAGEYNYQANIFGNAPGFNNVDVSDVFFDVEKSITEQSIKYTNYSPEVGVYYGAEIYKSGYDFYW